MEKNRVLTHSINQSPTLFDALGTEAFASEQHCVARCCSERVILRPSLVLIPGHLLTLQTPRSTAITFTCRDIRALLTRNAAVPADVL